MHFTRNALAHAGRSGRRVVAAFIATAFAQNDAEAAKSQWRKVADQLRPTLPKLAALMDEAETDVLAYMSLPAQHRAKLHSTNPLERLNGEIKRRTDVVGIFPNEAAITRLVGAILLEQTDEWAVQRARYMTLETMRPSAMIPPSACQPWPPDQPGPAGHRRRSPPATPRQGTRRQVRLEPQPFRVAQVARTPQPVTPIRARSGSGQGAEITLNQFRVRLEGSAAAGISRSPAEAFAAYQIQLQFA